MGKIRKVRCPHCKTVNDVDVDAEIQKQSAVAFRNVGIDHTASFDNPESLAIICTNCGEKFKINLSGE